jgi:hypothetical protein
MLLISMHKFQLVIAVIILTVVLNGCAHVPYSPGPGSVNPDNVKLREYESQIEIGRPHKLLDFAGSWLNPGSLIAKLLLWDTRVQDHTVSEETRLALQQYLIDNNLHDVKVRINQYSPGAEWSRLFRNRSVGGGWRYTLGILSVSLYTILPDRFFGGDHYNPYTHTINIYSGHPAIAVHEGGHAKDFEASTWRGSYAAIGIVPLTSLWFEAQATGDAIGYMREKKLKEMEKQGYKVLYPAYSTYIIGDASDIATYFGPVDPLVTLAIQFVAVIPCHIAARVKAASVTADDVDRKEVEYNH